MPRDPDGPDSVMVTFDDGGTPATHGPASPLATRYGYRAVLPMLLVLEAAPLPVPSDAVRNEARLRPRSALPGVRTLAVRLAGLLSIGLLARLRHGVLWWAPHVRAPAKASLGPAGRLGPVARAGRDE